MKKKQRKAYNNHIIRRWIQTKGARQALCFLCLTHALTHPQMTDGLSSITRPSKDECSTCDQTIILGHQIFLDHISSSIKSCDDLPPLASLGPTPTPPFCLSCLLFRTSAYSRHSYVNCMRY